MFDPNEKPNGEHGEGTVPSEPQPEPEGNQTEEEEEEEEAE